MCTRPISGMKERYLWLHTCSEILESDITNTAESRRISFKIKSVAVYMKADFFSRLITIHPLTQGELCSKHCLTILSISTPRYTYPRSLAMLAISTTGLTVVFFALYTSAIPTAGTPNIPALLMPRKVPADSACPEGQWLRRQCVPSTSAQAWEELCKDNQISKLGFCPSNKVCANTADGPDQIIQCK